MAGGAGSVVVVAAASGSDQAQWTGAIKRDVRQMAYAWARMEGPGRGGAREECAGRAQIDCTTPGPPLFKLTRNGVYPSESVLMPLT